MALALLLVAPGASARTAGITANSTPPGCNNCHGGGAVPTVTLTGPDTLVTGETGTYTLSITGGAGVNGGLNVSASNGAVLTSIGTQGTRRFNGEITHTSPKQFINGEVRWDFLVTAPCSTQAFVINGAGNSVDGRGRETGDRAGFATKVVSVTPGPCPDAGIVSTDAGDDPIPDEEPDAGDAPPGDGGVQAPGEPGDEEAAGCGCSSGGGGSGLLLALLSFALVRRVRPHA